MGRALWVWGRRGPPQGRDPPKGGSGGGRLPLPPLGATLARLRGALEALGAGPEPEPEPEPDREQNRNRELERDQNRELERDRKRDQEPERDQERHRDLNWSQNRDWDRNRTRRLLQEFGAPGGAGPRLQERLRRTRPSPPRLPEWPWGSSERLPLPVHTSTGLVLPRLDWEDWRGQLWFAARLISGVLDYREQLLRRDPPELWLQAAFGGCRVPGSRRDEVLRVPPGERPEPPEITVSTNGQFFQLGVSDPSGRPLPPPALLAALGGLRARAGGGGAAAPPPPLGLLTGQQRREWGRVHGAMMRDRLNRASLGRIQRSLLVLSLDSPVLTSPGGRGLEGGAAQVLHGGGASANSANRWWDKTLQLVIGQDGTCGSLFDPAVIDGAAVAELLDHALQHSRQLGHAPPRVATPPPRPQRLRFSVGPEMAPEVERAKRHLDSLAADVELHCLEHPGLGEGAGPRAESLVQVALQVAFYRAHGSLCATCEPLSLRQVLPGCTDLLRPPGPPCLALARALDEPEAQPQVLLALLREAVEALEKRTQEVLSGQGAERHLQHLRQAALAAGEPLPEIFLDPGYAQATHFRLCTVQVRSREGFWLLRGPLVPDGYGVGVGHVAPPRDPRDPSPSPGGLRVAVSAFRCCRATEAAHLGGAIRGVLDHLAALLRGGGLD